MINIEVPASYLIERSYILEVIFEEFLGLKILVKVGDRSNTKISIDDRSQLIIADGLFAIADHKWLTQESLPKQPLKIWNPKIIPIKPKLINNQIPVIYGDDPDNSNFFSVSESKIYLGLDIFGSAFFMLTRYEELIKTDRDGHDRFSAYASLAYQSGFLNRPLIDEYVEILWSAMQRLWPRLQRKFHQPKTLVSCDVDIPYSSYVNSWRATLIKTCGDLIKRRKMTDALQTIKNSYFTRLNNFRYDPLNTFDWIMDVNEKIGQKVAFYFLVDKSVPPMDGKYDINEPRIRDLIRHIYERGHEIGLHGSYGSYQDGEQLQKEMTILRSVFSQEKVIQSEIGCRQHYLRWSTPKTAKYLDAADLSYDTTLAYADHAGFRCGTCHEYQMFDLTEGRSLRIRERPLIVMECSVIDNKYMNQGFTLVALDIMNQLRNRSHYFGGNFTLLWHNSYLQEPNSTELYLQLLS